MLTQYNIKSIINRIFILLIFTVSFYLLIKVINAQQGLFNLWSSWKQYEFIGTYFCEHTELHLPIRQPINTLSNVFYLFIGIFFLRRGLRDIKQKNRTNLITANYYYTILYACISFYIFLASSIYHSSLVTFFSNIDYTAVYSLSLFPLMYFSHRIFLNIRGIPTNIPHKIERRWFILIFTSLYLSLTFIIPKFHAQFITFGLIILMISSGIYLELKYPGRTNTKYLFACLISISLAIMFFKFDTAKIWCNPNSIFQPHSAWHILSAIATFYFYMYIRSEKSYLQHLNHDEPLGDIVLHNRNIKLDDWKNKPF